MEVVRWRAGESGDDGERGRQEERKRCLREERSDVTIPDGLASIILVIMPLGIVTPAFGRLTKTPWDKDRHVASQCLATTCLSKIKDLKRGREVV